MKEINGRMYSLIYATAGIGKRFGFRIPKQFYKVYGIPLFIYPLLKILLVDKISEIIFIINKEFEKKYFEYIETFFYVKEDIFSYFSNKKINKKILDKLIKIILRIDISKKRLKFCYGGDIRQESIYNGLKIADEDKVLIYESSRPFITCNYFEKIISDPFENITYGDEVRFTVLEFENRVNLENQTQTYNVSNKYINRILEREKLVNIQLPQKFKKNELMLAHEKAKRDKKIFTDDSSLLFYYGKDIKILKGNPENIKITYKEEIDLYKRLFKKYLDNI
ncbi:MAG: 2-C-methyl-D-erythritol 4-phosphate cytidylyltransferase [Spirochaetes bacterium]|nr:2-C-methyl-D-erythritol 4-phosphate cytidylyltransferase [Spirochaetota bacterium]